MGSRVLDVSSSAFREAGLSLGSHVCLCVPGAVQMSVCSIT